MISPWIKNPLTRKRLRRFRAHKRAWWSFWILATAYLVSLGAELICNDRPLAMRSEGRWYFPIVRYHPEDTFLHNGQQTRPDYRALNANPAFRNDPNNFMLFPPVPFSPLASLDPASLQSAATLAATFTPMPHVGNVNVDTNLTVIQAQAAGHFFATNDNAVIGQSITSIPSIQSIPPGLQTALTLRFNNQPAPAAAFTPNLATELSLPAYIPRAAPPDTVRLTFRDPSSAATTPVIVQFEPDLRIATRPLPSVWEHLPESTRADITNLVARAAREYIPSTMLNVNGNAFRLDVRKQDITWPHKPVRGHWMGIDSAGRDVFARILYGFRISMSFGFLLVAVTMVLGVLIGAVQGFFGGRTDMFTQRAIEIWSALPFLYVMILLGSVFGRSFGLLLFCYGIFNWIGISYYIRAEFLRLRRQSYIEAARCLGIPSWRIMLEHILPNAITPLITFFPFSLVGAIAALYGLDYLGFGLPPPTPSWGELLFQAQQFRWAWWLILYPAAAIFIVMLLGVFIGEGVRDAFDPKPFSRME